MGKASGPPPAAHSQELFKLRNGAGDVVLVVHALENDHIKIEVNFLVDTYTPEDEQQIRAAEASPMDWSEKMTRALMKALVDVSSLQLESEVEYDYVKVTSATLARAAAVNDVPDAHSGGRTSTSSGGRRSFGSGPGSGDVPTPTRRSVPSDMDRAPEADRLEKGKREQEGTVLGQTGPAEQETAKGDTAMKDGYINVWKAWWQSGSCFCSGKKSDCASLAKPYTQITLDWKTAARSTRAKTGILCTRRCSSCASLQRAPLDAFRPGLHKARRSSHQFSCHDLCLAEGDIPVVAARVRRVFSFVL